jgi:hypothetical protein
MFRFAFLTAAALSSFSAPAFAQAAPAATTQTAQITQIATYAPITVAEVEAAQQAWGNALVAISNEYETKGIAAATKMAGDVIDSAYAYNMGPVLFKPTLTVAPQTFRTTRDGALSYFVGGNPAYKADTGFALKGWKSVKIQNAGITITGNSAISMGNVMFTNAKGEVTTVDKTWGYVRDGEGKLRIILHHSSLPYTPAK